MVIFEGKTCNFFSTVTTIDIDKYPINDIRNICNND